MSDEALYEQAEDAVNGGDVRAMTQLAFFKLSGRGGAEVDADEAVALLEERVKDGDCEAEWMLGLCCEYGIGTERDFKRAMSLYGDSCKGGNVVGAFLLNEGRIEGESELMIGWSLWKKGNRLK